MSAARSALGSALRVASPPAIVAIIALPAAVLELPGPVTGLPLGLLFVVTVQLAALVVAREGEMWSWFRVWLVVLATTVTLLPTVAIQAASSRVPYTTFSNGSAGLLIVSSLGAIAVLFGLMLLAAALAADAPENASILLTPALLLVPAVLGVPGDLGERSALLALAEAFGLAAVVIAIGWLLPRTSRPLVGLVALGVQFGALWILGFGPVMAPGRGLIVPMLAILLLATTVLVAAIVPIVALIANRFAQTVRDQPPERDQTRSDPTSHSDSPRSAARNRPRLSVPRRDH